MFLTEHVWSWSRIVLFSKNGCVIDILAPDSNSYFHASVWDVELWKPIKKKSLYGSCKSHWLPVAPKASEVLLTEWRARLLGVSVPRDSTIDPSRVPHSTSSWNRDYFLAGRLFSVSSLIHNLTTDWMCTKYITIYICYVFFDVEKLLKKEKRYLWACTAMVPFEFSNTRDTE